MALGMAHVYVPGECLVHRDSAASVTGDAKASRKCDGTMPEQLPVPWLGRVAVPCAMP
jgi:hypothetical protein